MADDKAMHDWVNAQLAGLPDDFKTAVPSMMEADSTERAAKFREILPLAQKAMADSAERAKRKRAAKLREARPVMEARLRVFIEERKAEAGKRPPVTELILPPLPPGVASDEDYWRANPPADLEPLKAAKLRDSTYSRF